MADLIALVSSILTGAAALGGVYLSTTMKSREDRRLRLEDRRLARVHIATDRSEQVYLVVDKTRGMFIDHFNNDLALLKGEITQKIRNERPLQMPDSFIGEMATARFTLEAHLPAAAEDFEVWRQATGDVLNTSKALAKRKREGSDISEEEIDQLADKVSSFARDSWDL